MPETRPRFVESDEGLDVPLHVQPRAKRNQIAGYFNGALKMKIAAPPVDDAANRAVIEFFASLLHLPRSRFHIIAGAKSRDKVLRIDDLSIAQFRQHIPEETPQPSAE
jgi:uncharacterized protein (TIGR00251 family)